MAKKKKPPTVTTALRRAVKDSGQSVFDVARGAGLHYSNLMHFLAGDRELSQREIDLLAAHLGLVLMSAKSADEAVSQ